MTATVTSISSHRRYEHAYLSIYKKWINSRREADYRSKGWALDPVSLLSPDSPNSMSIFYYSDLVEAYRIKLEIDLVTASIKGEKAQKPNIFSKDIRWRCKLIDEAIAKNFRAQKEDQ